MKPVIAILCNYIEGNGSAVFENIGAAGQDWMGLAADYIRSVVQSGGIPLMIPITGEIDDAMEMIYRCDGLIFPGGSDIDPFFYGEHPHRNLGKVVPLRDIFELEVLKRILEGPAMPVLGICRGLQLINAGLGGTLYQDIPSQYEGALRHSAGNYPRRYPSHEVSIVPETMFSELYGKERVRVNSYHHQGIKELADGLRVNMVSPDGMIEGVESTERKDFYAVQWHPEMMAGGYPDAKLLFDDFIRRCAEHREKRA